MKGELTISRVTSNQEGDYISLRIMDSSSRVPIVEVKVSLEEMTMALTGVASRPVDIKHILGVVDRTKVGKQLETKTIALSKPDWMLPEDEKEQLIYDEFFKTKYYPQWSIHNNGLKSQQPSDKHDINICRWV